MPAATRRARRGRFDAAPLLHSSSSADRLAERAARLLHQKRLDERVDVAVEHAVDVADLLLGAVVLDELIRLQDVAADLAAERDLLLDAADLVQLRLLLLHLQSRRAAP